MRTSKVMVAFVAEFSRGKSELINAIFFAAYGRRIMPASAGRTTMCPTELGYDPALVPSLRLLPIETRLEPHSLMHWRDVPERWTEITIDVDDTEKLAAAMHKVARRALGVGRRGPHAGLLERRFAAGQPASRRPRPRRFLAGATRCSTCRIRCWSRAW